MKFFFSWRLGSIPTSFLHTINIEASFLKKFFYLYLLFMTETERGRDTGRGRSRLHARSLMWDSILGLQDHTLGQRYTKPLSHQGCPGKIFLTKLNKISTKILKLLHGQGYHLKLKIKKNNKK